MAAPQRPAVIGAMTILVLMLIWEAAARLGWLDPEFSGQPSGILVAGYRLFRDQPMIRELRVTLVELVLGFTASALVGIPGGLFLGRNPRAQAFFDPILMSLYASPRAALIPVLILWFGLDLMTKSAVVFLGSVFPIMFNIMAGLKAVDPAWMRAARAFGATDRDIVRRVLLPGALPYLAAGLRLGLGRAITGVVVAEIYINTDGLGHQLMRAQVGLNANGLMFLVFLISGIGVALVGLFRRVEEHLGKWRQELS